MQSSGNLVTDGQTDVSDFIEGCWTNVKRRTSSYCTVELIVQPNILYVCLSTLYEAGYVGYPTVHEY